MEHLFYTLNSPVVRVRMRIQGKKEALFVFKRPTAARTREYFDSIRPTYRSVDGDSIRNLPVKTDYAARMLDEHLQEVLELPSLEKFETDLDDIRSALKQPLASELLFKLINEGLLGVTAYEEDETNLAEEGEDAGDEKPADKKLDFGSMLKAQPVYLGIKEWDEEGLPREYYIRVRMKEPSAVEQRQLKHAQPLVRKKRGDLEHQEDVGACNALFKGRVQAIDQCRFHQMGNQDADPVACTAENVAEWMPFVPYQIVTHVLSEEQMRGDLGND